MSPVASQVEASARLFHDGWSDVDATGLIFSHSHTHCLANIDDLVASPDSDTQELLDKIQHLLLELHTANDSNIAMHGKLDAHWVAVLLLATRSPLLKALPWQRFVLPPEMIFDITHVIDIGPYVRKLSMNRAISNDMMCRMIQYSLPYVKHNRLNFPRFKDMTMHVLVGLIQIVLALLLGLCSQSSKKPLWKMRFGILIYMHTLLSRGSQYDLYLFCLHNVNLVRIAVIEYFVYFVQTNMPCELATLNLMFGTHCNVHVVFRQFCINIDTFRVHCLQDAHLSWRELNEKAHYVIEKCNRLCKSKPKISSVKLSSTENCHGPFSKELMQIPRFKHVIYCKIMHPHLTQQQLEQVCFLHDNFNFTRLPAGIVALQSQAVLSAVRPDSHLYERCLCVHVCFRCLPHEKQINMNMRISSNGDVFCNTCHSKDDVFRVNLLGRILRIFKHLYYLCHVCLKVHTWHATGSEFFVCPVKQHVQSKSALECQLCMRNIGVGTHRILDSTLGVMQQVTLCHRHSPREHDVAWNHNLHALAQCVQRKMVFRSFRT